MIIMEICLALIHNNNPQRNAYIQPRLAELRTCLSRKFSATSLEVSFQPEIKPHGTPMAFLRDAIYLILDREWRRYRLLRSRFLLSDAPHFLVGSFRKYSRTRGGWRRSSAIEVVVTDKHIRAWAAFLETGADFLICFEDDAVFKDDSNQRVADLLDTLSRRNLDSPAYVDLAGGCRLEELWIAKLEAGQDAYFRHYSKLVTNTACAYLMSRPLVTTFHEILTRRPWLRLIGIDWLMNKLFITMANKEVGCLCMHADPTILKHGATTGDYVSWQAKVPH